MYKILFKLEYNYFISLKKRIVQKRLILIFCLFNMRTTLFGYWASPLRASGGVCVARACCFAATLPEKYGPDHCCTREGAAAYTQSCLASISPSGLRLQPPARASNLQSDRPQERARTRRQARRGQSRGLWRQRQWECCVSCPRSPTSCSTRFCLREVFSLRRPEGRGEADRSREDVYSRGNPFTR